MTLHTRGEAQSNLHLIASSNRELTTCQGAHLSWALFIYHGMVLSYAGCTLGTTGPSLQSSLFPQASLSLPPASHSRTCPLPPGIPSGLSSCQGHPGNMHPGITAAILAAPAGVRGPAALRPHLSDSSSVCSSSSTVYRFSRCLRTSSLGFQKSSGPPLPSSLMNTSLSCPRWPGGSEVPAMASGARARPPAHACPEAGLTQCPVSRARTSSPDVIFPEIWLMLVLPPKKGCGDMPEMDAGEGAELGRRRGPFLVGVRAPSPGAQQGRPHSPTAQPELQGAGSLPGLGARWWGRASASPVSAVWSAGSPFPSLRPSQAPAVLQDGQELLIRVPLIRKPSLGTERVVGDPPGPRLSPARAPRPPGPGVAELPVLPGA